MLTDTTLCINSGLMTPGEIAFHQRVTGSLQIQLLYQMETRKCSECGEASRRLTPRPRGVNAIWSVVCCKAAHMQSSQCVGAGLTQSRPFLSSWKGFFFHIVQTRDQRNQRKSAIVLENWKNNWKVLLQSWSGEGGVGGLNPAHIFCFTSYIT